jgi:hypothetical protein
MTDGILPPETERALIVLAILVGWWALVALIYFTRDFRRRFGVSEDDTP